MLPSKPVEIKERLISKQDLKNGIFEGFHWRLVGRALIELLEQSFQLLLLRPEVSEISGGENRATEEQRRSKKARHGRQLPGRHFSDGV